MIISNRIATPLRNWIRCVEEICCLAWRLTTGSGEAVPMSVMGISYEYILSWGGPYTNQDPTLPKDHWDIPKGSFLLETDFFHHQVYRYSILRQTHMPAIFWGTVFSERRMWRENVMRESQQQAISTWSLWVIVYAFPRMGYCKLNPKMDGFWDGLATWHPNVWPFWLRKVWSSSEIGDVPFFGVVKIQFWSELPVLWWETAAGREQDVRMSNCICWHISSLIYSTLIFRGLSPGSFACHSFRWHWLYISLIHGCAVDDIHTILIVYWCCNITVHVACTSL